VSLDAPAGLKRVLLVEDEVLVAMQVEDTLTELGFQVVALVTNLARAVDTARTADVDFAVLDINLSGELSFPVADVLTARGIPFLFVSGYGSKGLSPEYQHAVRLQKPFRAHDLSQAIGRLAR
jgi:DNA-binding response OmpR family regulator